MKISDLMLDMGTSDVTFSDAYVQEAVGKINVSSATYDAMYKVVELNGKPDSLIVQEAADAGLPTDPEGAAGVACEAVKHEISALYDAIVASAKSVKEVLGKSEKLAKSTGKILGISVDRENVQSFATKLASTLVGSEKKLTINDNRIIKSKYAVKMADAYESGVSKLLSAYGVSVNGDGGSVSSLKELSKRIDFGGKLVKFDKITSRDGHFTTTAKESDIVNIVVSLFRIYTFAEKVVNVAGSKSAKRNSMETINSLWNADCGGKKITSVIDSINSDIKEWTTNLTNIVDSIKVAMGDSFYAITESLSNK